MRFVVAFGLFLTTIGSTFGRDDTNPSIRVSIDSATRLETFSGRVLVVFSRVEPRPIVRSLNWFDPDPAFAVDVKDWKPGRVITLGSDAIAYPYALKDVPKRTYYVQAIVDRDLGGISCFSSPGNLYSKPVRVEFDPATAKPIDITIQLTVPEPRFPESDRVKLVDLPSPMLTAFHKKPMRMRAGVVLPPSYFTDADRKFPVVYEITGFGGDHTAAAGAAARKAWDVAGTEVIWVVLDGNCRLGHHVFADSANNGPVGSALVKELIPHIDRTYRGIGTPGTRLVTGHSSGGWSSLWLQVSYPDTFGGCWSTSPDPVDFRDLQRVNLYEAGANLFTDSGGQIRDLSRGDRGRTLTFKGFSGMEDVMGRGGQLASFEAVFSPRAADGTPKKLWDRKTGEIDPATAKAWEPYDIRLKLEREWKTFGPKLAGKVHVWMGDVDTFYLDGAVRLLKESQARLKSDAVIEMFPGKTHGLVNAILRKRMNEEMAATLRLAGGDPPR
jgi:S-formylglutathione hydrolase FrmB